MSVVKDRDFLSVTMAQFSVGKVDNAMGDLHDDVF